MKKIDEGDVLDLIFVEMIPFAKAIKSLHEKTKTATDGNPVKIGNYVVRGEIDLTSDMEIISARLSQIMRGVRELSERLDCIETRLAKVYQSKTKHNEPTERKTKK